MRHDRLIVGYIGSMNAKHAAFCREYLIDLNGAQAAIRAGYSPKSARVQASQLLTNPNIQAEIERLKEERNKRVEVDADAVLRELMRIGMSDLRDVMTWKGKEGKLKGSEAITTDAARAIEQIKIKPGKDGTSISIKMHDKVAALKQLADHIGLFDKETREGKDNERQIKIARPEGDMPV